MAGVCSLEVYEVEIEGMCWSVLDGSMPEKSFYQHCSLLHLHPFLWVECVDFNLFKKQKKSLCKYLPVINIHVFTLPISFADLLLWEYQWLISYNQAKAYCLCCNVFTHFMNEKCGILPYAPQPRLAFDFQINLPGTGLDELAGVRDILKCCFITSARSLIL